jgi:hypothetical protein
MALAFDRTGLDAPNVWNLSFVAFFAAGARLSLRHYPLLSWLAVSLPFFAMSDAVPLFTYAAVACVFAGLVLTRIHPLASRRRRTGVVPSPHLANLSFTAVPERIYEFNRGRRLLQRITAVCCLSGGIGALVWLSGRREFGLTVTLTSALLAGAFALFAWLNGRMRFRIDSHGVYSRVLFEERFIAWKELGGLSLRYLDFPGMGSQFVYYCVLSPTCEISFPSTLPGAAELRSLIESATGMTWPAAS